MKTSSDINETVTVKESAGVIEIRGYAKEYKAEDFVTAIENYACDNDLEMIDYEFEKYQRREKIIWWAIRNSITPDKLYNWK